MTHVPDEIGYDVPETVEAFTPAAAAATVSRTIVVRTFTLARPVIFPGPDGAYSTRQVEVTITENNRGGSGRAEALAVRVNLDPTAPNDQPAVQAIGDPDWLLLPDEVAALFVPPVDAD